MTRIKIIPLSAILFSVLLHVFCFFVVIPIGSRPEPEAASKNIQFIDAVIIGQSEKTAANEIVEQQESEPVESEKRQLSPDIPENKSVVIEKEKKEPEEEPVKEITAQEQKTSSSQEEQKQVSLVKNPFSSSERTNEIIESETETKKDEIITDEDNPSDTDDTSVINEQKKTFIPFYRVDQKPEFTYKAPLRYPEQAKSQNIEGTVIIEVDIDEKGKIKDIRIIKKAGFGFDEAALEMIRTSRFTPAKSAGENIPVRMQFTINFRLE